MHEQNFTLAKEYIVLNNARKLCDLVLSGFDIDKKSDKEPYSLLEYFLMFSQNFERPEIASLLYKYSRKEFLPRENLFLAIMQSNRDLLNKIHRNLMSSEDYIKLGNIKLLNKWDKNTPAVIQDFWEQHAENIHLSFLNPVELLELGTRIGNLSLINTCIDIHTKPFDINDYINVRNDSVIHIASGLGYPETIALLIKLGGNVNLANNFAWTPIHFAVRYGHTDAVKLLINKGADLTMKTSSNDTAFDLASKHQLDEIVSILRE